MSPGSDGPRVPGLNDHWMAWCKNNLIGTPRLTSTYGSYGVIIYVIIWLYVIISKMPSSDICKQEICQIDGWDVTGRKWLVEEATRQFFAPVGSIEFHGIFCRSWLIDFLVSVGAAFMVLPALSSIYVCLRTIYSWAWPFMHTNYVHVCGIVCDNHT